MKPPEIVLVDEHAESVGCDGGGGPLGHPLVYYSFGARDQVDCGYCGRRFRPPRHPGFSRGSDRGGGVGRPVGSETAPRPPATPVAGVRRAAGPGRLAAPFAGGCRRPLRRLSRSSDRCVR